MGLFEIFEMIISFIVGLFVQNKVTFGTPTATNNAQVSKDGSNYVVNKNSNVTIPLTFKGYKSYKLAYNSSSTGKYSSAGTCKKVGSSNKTGDIAVSSSDSYERRAKVIAYKSENCSGDSKEYESPKISYKAATPEQCGVFTYGGVEYTGVCDKSNGAYKRIGTQGPKTCNCYTKAYGIAMVSGDIYSPPNTNGMSNDKAWDTALTCWSPLWAGLRYLDDYIVEATTKTGLFEEIRKELKNKKRPVMVYVSTKDGSSHFFLVTAMKTKSLNNKATKDLTYSDFYILDPYYNGTANASIPPVEKNWSERINGQYGTLITSEARHNNYYIAKYSLF